MCEYCTGKEVNKPVYYDGSTRVFIEDGTNKLWIDDDFKSLIKPIKYCPMCGGKLEGVNDD